MRKDTGVPGKVCRLASAVAAAKSPSTISLNGEGGGISCVVCDVAGSIERWVSDSAAFEAESRASTRASLSCSEDTSWSDLRRF